MALLAIEKTEAEVSGSSLISCDRAEQDLASALAKFGQQLRAAVENTANFDDLIVELDCTQDGTARLKFRAYKHRRHGVRPRRCVSINGPLADKAFAQAEE
jgi:hypothetical protein